MEKNFEKKMQVMDEIQHELDKRNSHYYVAALIYGCYIHLDERMVRALQVIAKRKGEESDESFNEFCDNVIVYSNTSDDTSDHVMHFRKDGIFVEDFEDGFYDVCCKLAFEIL